MMAYCTFSVCQRAALTIPSSVVILFYFFVVKGFNILRTQVASIYVSAFLRTAVGQMQAVPAEPSQRRPNASSHTAVLAVWGSTERWDASCGYAGLGQVVGSLSWRTEVLGLSSQCARGLEVRGADPGGPLGKLEDVAQL